MRQVLPGLADTPSRPTAAVGAAESRDGRDWRDGRDGRDGRLTPPGGAPLQDLEGLDVPLADALDAYERVLIVRALSVSGGNVAEAARRLQTDRPNLYRRMKRLGIGG